MNIPEEVNGQGGRVLQNPTARCSDQAMVEINGRLISSALDGNLPRREEL